MYDFQNDTPPEYDPPKSSFGWFLSSHPEIEILACIILISILFIGAISIARIGDEAIITQTSHT